MSKWTYARPAVVLSTAVLLLVTACGGGSTSPAAATRSAASTASGQGGSDQPAAASSETESAPSVPSCLSGSSAREVTLPNSDHLDVTLVGSARRVVVVSNQSDEDRCAWVAFARTLVAHGFAVALWDYRLDPQSDLADLVAYLSKMHDRVALVGASKGAKTSIIVASKEPQRVTTLVSLSAEKDLAGVLIAPYAARLTRPTLFVTAADDQYGAAAATRTYARTARSKVHELEVVAGSAHGTALLAHAAVSSRVVRFLAAHLPG